VRASKPYVAVIGLLISQYTITGFDASAHLAEETRNAARSSPIGVLMSVAISAVFGWFLMLSYLFAIQDLDAVINNSYGQPVLQIMIDSCGIRGGQALMVGSIVRQLGLCPPLTLSLTSIIPLALPQSVDRHPLCLVRILAQCSSIAS